MTDAEVLFDDFSELRATLARALAIVDRVRAGTAPDRGARDAARWRRYPGGPLSDAGIAEIERRFGLGEPDAQIAIEMKISLSGVAGRRTIWRAKRSKKPTTPASEE